MREGGEKEGEEEWKERRRKSRGEGGEGAIVAAFIFISILM